MTGTRKSELFNCKEMKRGNPLAAYLIGLLSDGHAEVSVNRESVSENLRFLS